MERDALRTQTNEFVTEIQQLEEQVRTLQRTESEAVQVRQRHSKLVASLASLNRELVSIAPEPVDTEASSADGTGAVARRAPPADADQQLFNEDDSSGFGAEQRPKSAALIERQQEQRLVDDLRRQCRARGRLRRRRERRRAAAARGRGRRRRRRAPPSARRSPT